MATHTSAPAQSSATVETRRGGVLRDLPVDEARRLLRTRRVGRVAFPEDTGVVAVLPVNYRFDGTGVVFRTAGRASLRRARQGAVVTFQVDAVDEATRTGWSVVVHGPVSDVTGAGAGADPDAWPDGPHMRLLRIEAQQISGRRIDERDGEACIWIG